MASTIKVTDIAYPGSANTAITINSDDSVSMNGGVVSPQTGFKNRIINGGMTIDQRNAGASVTVTVDGQYGSCDRWSYFVSQTSKFSVQQNAGAVTPPTGYTNYLGATSLSAYSVISNDYFAILQKIEGFNTADLAWGTANAATVTLSFWVRSSLTGTFGGAITNAAYNRSYPFTYTINAASTWEQKTITIPGDTTGTWLTNNGQSLTVQFGLGASGTRVGTAGSWSPNWLISATGATSVVGTSGATFYITGVQLEKGSTATPFEFRSYGQELALCQRYYWKRTVDIGFQGLATGAMQGTGNSAEIIINYPQQMRSSPVITQADLRLANGAAGSDVTSLGAGYIGVSSALQTFVSGSAFSASQAANLVGRAAAGGFLAASAEL